MSNKVFIAKVRSFFEHTLYMVDSTVSYHDSIQARRVTYSWLVIWTFVQWFMHMKYMLIRVSMSTIPFC